MLIYTYDVPSKNYTYLCCIEKKRHQQIVDFFQYMKTLDVVIMYDRFIAAVLTDKSSSIIQSQLN